MKYKMKNVPRDHFALLHMIGQLHDLNCSTVSSSQIAKIMNVTLPTAIKRLNELAEQHIVYKHEVYHRKNAVAYRWQLSGKTKRQYENRMYWAYYMDWKDDAFGVQK